MDWTGLPCDVVRLIGFPAIALFFALMFALEANDRC